MIVCKIKTGNQHLQNADVRHILQYFVELPKLLVIPTTNNCKFGLLIDTIMNLLFIKRWCTVSNLNEMFTWSSAKQIWLIKIWSPRSWKIKFKSREFLFSLKFYWNFWCSFECVYDVLQSNGNKKWQSRKKKSKKHWKHKSTIKFVIHLQ